MKIKKLIFGMAFVSPLLFASCNSVLTFEKVKQWMSEHYKSTDPALTIPVVSWDFHATSGETAKGYISKILEEIKDSAGSDYGLEDYIIPSGEDLPVIGQKIAIPGDGQKSQTIKPLNANIFKPYSVDEADDVYKINDNAFTVTYKNVVNCLTTYSEEGEPVFTKNTCVQVYNKTGYCTDFGYKVNKYINKDNSIKFKLLIHFIYTYDPFD